MRIPATLIAATLLGSVLPVHPQERKESSGPAVFRVEFDIRNGIDGETQPSQHFSMLIDESRKGIFQAGNRVRVATASPQYVDVGVNIECTVHESDGKAVLRGGIELTSLKGYVNLSAISQPIIGQRKVTFNSTVELGTATVIVGDRNLLALPPVSVNRTDVLASGISGERLAIGAAGQVEATVTRVN
jgi:hypothetical protein